jgi:tetratricopeptide (TPR) repeat protein
MAGKVMSVDEMLHTVDISVQARQARFEGEAPKPSGPLFTFLIGAGFSMTAGLSSVNHLVVSLEHFKKDRNRSWHEVFDQALEDSLNEKGLSGVELTDYYFQLMGEVLPLPQSRHDFITAAIQWAAARRVPMNIEGILLANLLMAGTGRPVSLHPRREGRHWLSRAFARHVFTTNFDEVVPNTFYLGNQPVEIIDAPGVRAINAAAEYPTVVYLHGRHLHFDLRNTPVELHAESKGPQSFREDLFHEFRSLLRSTGLIVIGYAGARDRVCKAIVDALKDSESLPYGLWWNGYRDVSAIHPEMRQAIEENDRAFYLAPGHDAEQIMRGVARGVGLDEIRAIEKWTTRLQVINTEVNRFLKRAQYDFRQFQLDATQALMLNLEDDLTRLANLWRDMSDHVMDHSDKKYVAELFLLAARLMMALGRKADVGSNLAVSLELFEKIGLDEKLGQVRQTLGELQQLSGQMSDSRESFVAAAEAFERADMKLGQAQALVALAEVLVEMGEHESARVALEKALHAFQGKQYPLGEGQALLGLAQLAQAEGHSQKATELALQALELHRQDGSEVHIVRDLRALAQFELRELNPQVALSRINEALDLARGADLPRELARSLLTRAEIALAEKKDSDASEALDQSRKILERLFDARATQIEADLRSQLPAG